VTTIFERNYGSRSVETIVNPLVEDSHSVMHAYAPTMTVIRLALIHVI